MEQRPDGHFMRDSSLSREEMKAPRKFRIIPQWEPERRFALPLHHHAPIARSAPEFLPEALYQLEELLRTTAPLR